MQCGITYPWYAYTLVCMSKGCNTTLHVCMYLCNGVCISPTGGYLGVDMVSQERWNPEMQDLRVTS